MIFQKRCSRKQYWAYRNPTPKEVPALQNRLSSKDFWFPEMCFERLIWKKNIPDSGKGVTFGVGVLETFFRKGHSRKQKRREVQCAEMYLAWTVGVGECWNLSRYWKNTSNGTFDARMRMCCGKKRKRNRRVWGRKKQKKKIQGLER